MCIRDSHIIAQFQTIGQHVFGYRKIAHGQHCQVGRVGEGLLPVVGAGTVAVPDRGHHQPVGEGFESSIDRYIAVSYTHLDVYQRQVLVYAKLETDNKQVRQLPLTVYAQFTEDFVDFSLNLGKVRVWSTPVRGPATPATPSSNHVFRYVLIPGGQAGRIDFETLTYAEAKERFALTD